jgi:hypothetical protein
VEEVVVVVGRDGLRELQASGVGEACTRPLGSIQG